MSRVLSSSTVRKIVSKVEKFTLPSDPETTVYIRQLPIGVIRKMQAAVSRDDDEGDAARAKLIKMSIVDEEGSPVFDESYPLMDEMTAELLTDLMTLIGKANNKAAGKSNITEQVDAAEKN